MNSKPHVVVLGSNLAGLTAALELCSKLCRITVISNSPLFTFTPALVWVPFGLENSETLQFDVRPILKANNIAYIKDDIEKILPKTNTVKTAKHEITYDYLIVATGASADKTTVPGPSSMPHVASVCTYKEALEAKLNWQNFQKDPGPIVIGFMPDAIAKGAAYEFALVLSEQLKKRKLYKKASVTFVTPEKDLSHLQVELLGYSFVLSKHLFRHYDINWCAEETITRVTKDTVYLSSDITLESKFTMIIPQFKGAKCIQNSSDLESRDGFLPVTNLLESRQFSNVFVAGLAIDAPPQSDITLSYHLPKREFPVERLAKVAAWNVLSKITNSSSYEIDIYSLKKECQADIQLINFNLVNNILKIQRNQEFHMPGYRKSINKLALFLQETFVR